MLKSLKTSTVWHLLLVFNFLEPVLCLYQKHPQINLRKQVLGVLKGLAPRPASMQGKPWARGSTPLEGDSP